MRIAFGEFFPFGFPEVRLDHVTYVPYVRRPPTCIQNSNPLTHENVKISDTLPLAFRAGSGSLECIEVSHTPLRYFERE